MVISPACFRNPPRCATCRAQSTAAYRLGPSYPSPINRALLRPFDNLEARGPVISPSAVLADNFSCGGTISHQASLQVCLTSLSRRSRMNIGQPCTGCLAPPHPPIVEKCGTFPYLAPVRRASDILRRGRHSFLTSATTDNRREIAVFRMLIGNLEKGIAF